MSALLQGGRVLDPSTGRDEIADILIGDDGTIERSAPQLSYSKSLEVFDCTGLVVAPGLIDLHVHLRVPGQEYKEDIASGTAAAAAGGFTSIVCQPNTAPPLDDAGVIRDLIHRSKGASARIYPLGAVSMGLANMQLSEMAELKDAGVVGIGDDAFPVHDSGFMRRAMEYCKMLDLTFYAHCEDKDITGDGVMNEGLISTVLGLRGISRSAENIGTVRNILLALSTGCRLHVLHVSCKESVEIIRHAKKFGAPITCETCPQYFSLTDSACEGYDSNAKMSPPLRTKADQEAVIEGLVDGVIDCIATDHAPHAPHEKEQEFSAAPFGMVGLETAFAVGITHLVKPGILTEMQLIEKMSTVPAKIARIPGGASPWARQQISPY